MKEQTTEDWLEAVKQHEIEQAKVAEAYWHNRCPGPGYCPCCGRPYWTPPSYYPDWTYRPYWPNTVTCTMTTG